MNSVKLLIRNKQSHLYKTETKLFRLFTCKESIKASLNKSKFGSPTFSLKPNGRIHLEDDNGNKDGNKYDYNNDDKNEKYVAS